MKTRTIAGQLVVVFLTVVAASLSLTGCGGENGPGAPAAPTETPRAVAQDTAAATPDVPTPTAAPAPTVMATPANEAPYVELIAYIAPDGNVWTIRPDGTDARRLTSNSDNAQPAWSPDGTRLAYIHNRREVHLMGPDGSGDSMVSFLLSAECTQGWDPTLTSLNAMRSRVRFTPDGKGLRLGIDWGGITNQFICHIPLDPAVAALPTVDTADEFDVNPVDGRLVATASGQGCAGMYLIGPSNEEFDNRPRIGPKMGDGCSIPEYQPVALPVYPYAPTWSPDGRQIAFYGIDFGEAGSHLYVMDAQANTFPQPIAAVSTPQDLSGGALGLSWSPDGTQIAFESEGGIWTTDSGGEGTPFKVADGHYSAWGRAAVGLLPAAPPTPVAMPAPDVSQCPVADADFCSFAAEVAQAANAGDVDSFLARASVITTGPPEEFWCPGDLAPCVSGPSGVRASIAFSGATGLVTPDTLRTMIARRFEDVSAGAADQYGGGSRQLYAISYPGAAWPYASCASQPELLLTGIGASGRWGILLCASGEGPNRVITEFVFSSFNLFTPENPGFSRWASAGVAGHPGAWRKVG